VVALDKTIHWRMAAGLSAGMPWCRSDCNFLEGVPIHLDDGPSVTTARETEVTCPECRGFLRRIGALAVATSGDVDWFGESE